MSVAQKVIKPIEIESFQYLLEHIEEYKEIFITNAVIVFRGVAISRGQQLILMRKFGDKTGWFPNSTSDITKQWSYEENHSHTIDTYNKHNISKDEILIPWHIEHIGYKNPAVGASWNMEKFTCERGIGNTLFVNVADVYDDFDDEKLEFLNKCRIAYLDYSSSIDEEPAIHPAIQLHRPSGRYALRLSPQFNPLDKFCYLHEFDGTSPTEPQQDTFAKICKEYVSAIQDNQANQQVHIWEQNDVVVADLFLMAHAVLGGFKPEDRFFYGCWAHAEESSKFGEN